MMEETSKVAEPTSARHFFLRKDKGSGLRYDYTVAFCPTVEGTYFAFSKCSRGDDFNKRLGRKIAYGRLNAVMNGRKIKFGGTLKYYCSACDIPTLQRVLRIIISDYEKFGILKIRNRYEEVEFPKGI